MTIRTHLLRLAALASSVLALAAPPARAQSSAFRQALTNAEHALESRDLAKAREQVQRALERDRRSVDAWSLRARLAEAEGRQDERLWALHQALRLATAQERPAAELNARREALYALDPIAPDLFGLRERFTARLAELAAQYEEQGRPHSAIAVHKRILALDPDRAESQAAIERIASTPDPSLAGDAKPKDLFGDVTQEWIADFDREHATWKERASLERPNYTTYTDAGYEVLVRVAEAMEQMNAFYRQFFRFGTAEHKGTVPRVLIHVFKTRDEYLQLGIGPPEKWTGGHFTGTHVETYLTPETGFDGMVNTLFHEAAHQFVSLATQAVGWLNEGLASFFEGTRMLPNGTVIMNLPANHRLFDLAQRMEQGWMADEKDGIDPKNTDVEPTKAPRFRTVLENRYTWGPPWYSPTWGVVYFLYNYQDLLDGRYVYRDAFAEFIDKSGGRVGEGAVENFVEVVLGHPKPPIRGVERKGAADVALPKTIEALDAVWKDWIVALRDEQSGKLPVNRPWKEWGAYAVLDGDYQTAKEHFEKGLVETPEDAQLSLEFAELLAEHLQQPDRATKLLADALGRLERAEVPDERLIRDAERRLEKLDPNRKSLAKLEADLGREASALVARYQEAKLPVMVADTAWRLGSELDLPELFGAYEQALREGAPSLAIWELAYDEESLEGWKAAGTSFRPSGIFLDAELGEYDPERFDYQVLALDKVTAGDFSMETLVQAERGQVGFAGLVFGKKDEQTFHGLLYFPPKAKTTEGTADSAYVDLMSSIGGLKQAWRHVAVEAEPVAEAGRSAAATWHRLRLDVTGRFVDLWFDGEVVASHEFPSVDVLRGGFGLITGPGKARFRDVRYLARDRRDPAAQLERGVRQETQQAAGEAVGGSWLGQVPPFPQVARWLQGSRVDWKEAGPVPQLLVLFSIAQNDLVRIDDWLRDLAERGRAFGLEIVAIASANDEAALAQYLESHAFPGAVGLDARTGPGLGDTFEAYFVRRFNLPRLLLLDLDQKVAWEGDPGFEAGIGWDRKVGSYLDDPLKELVAQRGLRELPAWRARWQGVQESLARGELASALPVLVDAAKFDQRFFPEVALAQARLAGVRALCEELGASAEALAAAGAEPCVPLVRAWCDSLEIAVPAGVDKQLKKLAASKAAKDWDKVAGLVDRWSKQKKSEADRASFLVDALARLDGALPEALLEQLRAAQAAEDWAAFERAAQAAASLPARWLVREHLGWQGP